MKRWVAVPRNVRRAVLGLTLAMTFLSPPSLCSQEPASPDSLHYALAPLLEALPGRPVALDSLIRAARRLNLEMIVSRANVAELEGRLMESQGLFDPELLLSSDLRKPGQAASAGFGGYGLGVTQRFGLGTEVTLRVAAERTAPLTGSEELSSFSSVLDVSLMQPLLEGAGYADLSVNLARAERDAQASIGRRTEELVVAETELRYLDLRESEALEAILQKSLDVAEELLFRNEELARRDLVAQIDVVTARSGAALRRAALLDAQRARRDASDAIAFSVWGEEATRMLAADTLPFKTIDELPPTDAVAAPSSADVEEALRRRLDVVAARQRLEGLEEVARASSVDVRPRLDLVTRVVTGGGAGTFEGANRLLNQGASWQLGLQLSQPLRNRVDRGRLAGAASAVTGGEAVLAAAENRVREEVRSAERAVEWGRLRLEQARLAAELAGLQLRGEEQRLELGLGDSFRLLLTEERTAAAELEMVQAEHELARALVRLRLATGRTLEPYAATGTDGAGL
jgi:HAE1 family hydrophobic/amphiphilic exporter-1